MDAGSAAALYAGSVVLRKTFEAVAQRSLSSIFSSLHARFRGQNQLQSLQKELESRLQVLSLPVDMCIQYVLHGNTALQGALDMVILLINDIVSFQEELEAQSYNESILKLSQSEAAKRLEGFLSRLDTILPYLALAVNAVSLLQTTHAELSPSRLVEASHMIRTADSNQGVIMKFMAKLHKFETRLTLPRWQEKMLQCRVSLGHSSYVQEESKPMNFELAITNEEPCEDCKETSLHFPVDEISAVGSSTLHVLGLGEHNLEAVLLLDLMDGSKKMAHYALQCIDDCHVKLAETQSNEKSESESEGDDHEIVDRVGTTHKLSRLGLFEYVLRLCMLQSREERNHWEISDERIRMFFADPRYLSEPMPNVQKAASVKGDDVARTPNQKKKSSESSAQSPKQSSRRVSITEMFYDLQVDSPANKLGRDESKA